jgi:glycosyltransferase involved in cell wall biosynthesis
MLGFNVIGHVSGNLGLGVLARNVVRLLVERGFAVAVLDVDPGLNRSGHDLRFAGITVADARDLPFNINLFVLPAPTLQTLLPSLADTVLPHERLNAALPMWELPILPHGWDRIFEFFDVLLAGSPFIRAALEFSVSNVFIVPIDLPIYLPDEFVGAERISADTSDSITFTTAFDPYSDPARKNPSGTIEAFRIAALEAPNARLIVKINSAADDCAGRKALSSLQRIAAGCPKVEFLTGTATYEEALAVYANADVVVSLHRAEGLGLVPMEAMAMGKPVIATAWSGNMAFMCHRSACLVNYRLAEVREHSGLYRQMLAGRHARWAEPDLYTAANWIVRLSGDATLRKRYGAAARTNIAVHQQRAAAASFADELREILHNYDCSLRRYGTREAKLRAIKGLPLPMRDRISRAVRLFGKWDGKS